jgi:hypothetical protein
VIEEQESEVVRRIFREYVAGRGLKKIAMRLNSEGIPSPAAGRRGTGTWSPSCVSTILRRERYVGLFIHGEFDRPRRNGKRLTVKADVGQLQAQLAASRRAPALLEEALDEAEDEVRAHMGELSTLLLSNEDEAARSVYRALFPDGLRFTPFDIPGTRRRVWRIEGAAELSTLESDPSGIRTRVLALKGRCPGPD